MRHRIRQPPRQIVEVDFCPICIQAQPPRVQILPLPLEVLHNQGRLEGYDGGEIVAFGEEVPVLGEVDVVRGVDFDYDSGWVDTDGAVWVREVREDRVRDAGEGRWCCR